MFRLYLLLSLLLSPLFASPTVLVTLAPNKFLIEKIAKDELHVIVLVPPGVDPHTFEFNTKKLVQLTDAKIWFSIGEAWEKKAGKILCKNMPCYNLRDSLPTQLLHSGDSHIWLTPKLLKFQAEKIEEKLSALFPEKSDTFKKNKTNLLQELDELHQQISALTQNSKGKTILVAHPAFGYFTEEYGLNQLSIEEEGKELSPKSLINLINKAKKANVTQIIVMPEYSTKEASVLAKELNVKLVFLDPYSENVIENLKEIAKVLSE